MSANPFPLRWEVQHSGGVYAYRGQIIIGMVGKGADGLWFYQIHAVEMNWISKGRGRVRSKYSAIRAVNRAWKDWLEVTKIIGGEA